MVLIGSALGDGIDDGAGGAAILGGIVGSIDLKFLDCGLGARVADTRAAALLGEESLIVVAAVNRIVVQKSAHATETNQSKSAGIVDCAGSQQSETGPAAAVDGEVANRGLVEGGSKFLGIC